jgi:hypothetical protein
LPGTTSPPAAPATGLAERRRTGRAPGPAWLLAPLAVAAYLLRHRKRRA